MRRLLNSNSSRTCSRHYQADPHHDQDEGERDADGAVGNPAGEAAAGDDAGQRADQKRPEQPPVDRAERPVARARDQRQRDRVGDVGADDARAGSFGNSSSSTVTLMAPAPTEVVVTSTPITATETRSTG